MDKNGGIGMKPTDIRIMPQEPAKIEWNCPHCGNKISMTYEQFCSIYGNKEWQYKETECMACGNLYYFDNEHPAEAGRR